MRYKLGSAFRAGRYALIVDEISFYEDEFMSALEASVGYVHIN